MTFLGERLYSLGVIKPTVQNLVPSKALGWLWTKMPRLTPYSQTFLVEQPTRRSNVILKPNCRNNMCRKLFFNCHSIAIVVSLRVGLVESCGHKWGSAKFATECFCLEKQLRRAMERCRFLPQGPEFISMVFDIWLREVFCSQIWHWQAIWERWVFVASNSWLVGGKTSPLRVWFNI